MNGGRIIASILKSQGVQHIFTLIGGHISPILTESKSLGLKIVDVRDEANAVFAADAMARMTGIPGIAVVTAGPGVTNTITAIKNAQMAQSPVILLGGAAATVLKGKGALQDIEQLALMRSIVKWETSVKRIRDLGPAMIKAFRMAQQGTPGPVFIECPIDLLYEEKLVRSWYGGKSGHAKSIGQKVVKAYLEYHLNRMYKGKDEVEIPRNPIPIPYPHHDKGKVKKLARMLNKAKRPVIVVGSQALLDPAKIDALAEGISLIGAPVYLSGMARGMLGAGHPLQMRHKRRMALKDADLVLLAGVTCDFRLDYGNHIPKSAKFVSVNRSRKDLYLNRRPNLAVLGDPAEFLTAVGKSAGTQGRYNHFLNHLREREAEREKDIDQQAKEELEGINPLQLFRELDPMLDKESILIADGGDFVGTASYTLRPRGPLSWLDPGAFGTLGVGGGFALGAGLVRPEAETWIIWGDGSSAYSLAEFDSFVRHGVPVIGLIGNDACWSQIARDQVELLGDDVGCGLAHTNYDRVARGYGGFGRRVDNIEDFKAAVIEAKASVKAGKPYLINAIISKSDFRKGSISV